MPWLQQQRLPGNRLSPKVPAQYTVTITYNNPSIINNTLLIILIILLYENILYKYHKIPKSTTMQTDYSIRTYVHDVPYSYGSIMCYISVYLYIHSKAAS